MTVVGVALTVASQIFGGPLGYVTVSGRSMEPTIRSGDLVFVLRQSTYQRGDVVAFRVPADEPGSGGLVIHRVTGGTARDGYRTRGDNREGSDPWRTTPNDVIGKLAIHVPRAGLAPVFLGSPFGLGLMGALLTFLVVSGLATPPVESRRASCNRSGAGQDTS
ncbi:MAG: signal peptidase I [Gaiellaceae bacterium]